MSWQRHKYFIAYDHYAKTIELFFKHTKNWHKEKLLKKLQALINNQQSLYFNRRSQALHGDSGGFFLFRPPLWTPTGRPGSNLSAIVEPAPLIRCEADWEALTGKSGVTELLSSRTLSDYVQYDYCYWWMSICIMYINISEWESILIIILFWFIDIKLFFYKAVWLVHWHWLIINLLLLVFL